MKCLNVEGKSLSDKLIEILSSVSEKIEESSLMLSGGVDSSLLLAIFGDKVHPYTVSYKHSADLDEARYVSSFYNMELTEINVTRDCIIQAAKAIKVIDPDASILEISFEIPFYIGCKRTKEKYIITGQGADEIFYGYSKFRDGREQTNKSSLEILTSKTLPRELKISDHFGKTPIMPYMSEEIVSFFGNLPPDIHMNRDRNKLIIREACQKVGVPERIYRRPKKAAQYGSGIMKVLKESRGVIGI